MILKNTRWDSIPELLGTIGSRIFSLFITIEMIRRYCPREIINGVDNFFKKLSYFFNPYIHISIHEFVGNNLRPHEAYATVGAYLSINSSKTGRKLKAEKVRDSNKMVMSMDEHEKVFDQFHGVEVKWISGKNQPLTKTKHFGYYSSFPEQERKYYKLVFHKQHRDLMFGPYLEHVIISAFW